MAEAIAVAAEGVDAGELPVGAVVVANGAIVGRAHTQERAQRRLLVHAELLALDAADRVPAWDRRTATLYTTVEPCLMCLGATAAAMVGRIVFAVAAPTDGAAHLAAERDARRADGLPHVQLPDVTAGVGRADAEALMQRYLDRRGDAEDGLTTWVRSLLAR
jgi:tRNA(adenine34) deaminase